MAVTTDDRRVAEALAEIERLQSARGVQDAALACLRNDLRECAIRAERAEAERDALRALTPAMMDAAFAAVQPTSGREWFRAMYNAAIDAALAREDKQ